ncbi:MAG: hypothetical protein K0S74_475 [Chlamydiales bacterium]|nr:hypothetical protein [Chlamydiales bacterium]
MQQDILDMDDYTKEKASLLVETIAPAQVKQALDQGISILIIDVREEEEYTQEHIKEGYLLPLSLFYPQKVPIESPNQLVVFQCRSGARSYMAAQQFKKAYPHIRAANLEGGIIAWKKAGLVTQT